MDQENADREPGELVASPEQRAEWVEAGIHAVLEEHGFDVRAHDRERERARLVRSEVGKKRKSAQRLASVAKRQLEDLERADELLGCCAGRLDVLGAERTGPPLENARRELFSASFHARVQTLRLLREEKAATEQLFVMDEALVWTDPLQGAAGRGYTCSICYEDTAGADLKAFVPCGHVVCASCCDLGTDNRCYMCRGPVDRAVLLHFG